MKKSIIFAAGALLTLGFSACNSDEPGNGGVAQKDEDRYLRVNIVNPTGSRADADDFEPGTAKENYVQNMFMDFYDNTGNFVKRANWSDIQETTWDPENKNPGAPGTAGNVGKVGTFIVKIGLEKTQNLPSYVMCYINPVEWTDGTTAAQIPMADLRDEKRKDYKNGNGNFAMTNSCYFGTDSVTGLENVKISGTPINAKLLYTSLEAAKKDASASVNIYVERYAAKVKFTMDVTQKDIPYAPEGKGIYAYNGITTVDGADINYSLKFTPEKWTINADAPDMYAVKNFQAIKGNPVATFAEVSAYLGDWSSDLWNDKKNYRSYWSCSPAFFAEKFPEVSDQISDLVTDGTKGAGTVVAPYALKYYSYNQICGTGGNGESSFAAGVKYALENTMGKPAFESRNPKAAVPTVLVVGGYKATYNGTELPEGTSFYINGNSLYFTDVIPEGVTNGVKMIDKFIADQQIIYVKDGENYTLLRSDNMGDAVFEVRHPAKAVRGENRVSERFVTLQLKSVGDTELYYIPTGGGYTRIKEGNLNLVNTVLWQQSGVAYAYTKGKCYYSIPIWHLGMTENTVEKPLKDGAIVWDKLRVGDLGLVRNHVYNLEVDAITGLATGINDLNNPIVPPMDQDEYWIKYQINILNWRIVPTQGGIVL